MKKIRTTVRITELDTLSDVLLRLYKADSGIASDDYLKSTMAEIESLSERITIAIRSDRASSTLDEADIKRDDIIRSLGALLNGYAAIPIADKKAAAEKLLDVFNKYKGITGESYANESSLIESMVKDYEASELADSIKALDGVSLCLANLRSAQDEFNKANDVFTAANVNKGESASSLKKPLLAAINDKFVAYLTAMNLVNKAVYGDFVSKAEAEIEKMNNSVAKRGKSVSGLQ